MYEVLIKKIQNIKPNLKINSIMTYITSLKMFFDPKSDMNDTSTFDNPEKIIKLIKDQPLTTQKTDLLLL